MVLDKFDNLVFLVSSSMSLSVGSRVEARDFSEGWHIAEIVEVDYDEMEVLVQYEQITKK